MMRIHLLLLLLFAGMPAVSAQVAVLADTLYTMAGPPVLQGVVLIREGKIQRVGSSQDVRIPEGFEVHRARVVTPGLVDGRSVVGLAGKLNVPGDQQQLETSSPIQPELRALDAYDPEEELVAYLRTQGVTTIHTGHAPGALISGQTLVAKTRSGTLEETVLRPACMLSMTLGNEVGHRFPSPGTRAKGVAMLREELLRARAWKDKRAAVDPAKRPEPNLRLEALSDLLDGRYKAMIHAHTAVDIQNAFRLAREFGFPLVIEGGSEIYRILDLFRASGAELILHPTMARAYGDQKNLDLSTAARLAGEGIPFSLQSGFESYVPKTRVIRYEAAMAIAYGLPREAALASITIQPARLLGLEDRIGSIEAGKDADLVLYDGDPFEYLTRVCKVFIDGQLAESRCDD
jgi:imidazolonepropionase-like amidohydrolase